MQEMKEVKKKESNMWTYEKRIETHRGNIQWEHSVTWSRQQFAALTQCSLLFMNTPKWDWLHTHTLKHTVCLPSCLSLICVCPPLPQITHLQASTALLLFSIFTHSDFSYPDWSSSCVTMSTLVHGACLSCSHRELFLAIAVETRGTSMTKIIILF